LYATGVRFQTASKGDVKPLQFFKLPFLTGPLQVVQAPVQAVIFKFPFLTGPLQVMQAPVQAVIFKLPYLAGPLQVVQAPAQAIICVFPSQISRGGLMLGPASFGTTRCGKTTTES
jgi:hypothetical protein